MLSFTQANWNVDIPCACRGALCVSCPIQEKTVLTVCRTTRTKTELSMRIRAGYGAMTGRIQSCASLSWRGKKEMNRQTK